MCYEHWEVLDFYLCFSVIFIPSLSGEDKATIPVTDTEFNQTGNPQSFCTGVSVHHPALIQNTGPLIDMSDIRPGTSKCSLSSLCKLTGAIWCKHKQCKVKFLHFWAISCVSQSVKIHCGLSLMRFWKCLFIFFGTYISLLFPYPFTIRPGVEEEC